jgi:hypothetical protein
VGPNGTGAYLRSLRHLFEWSHPTVNVLEFSDMDSGHPAYEDDLIRVFALTSPAFDWTPPPTTSLEGTTPPHALNHNLMGLPSQAHAPTATFAAGTSSSLSSSSEASDIPDAATAQGPATTLHSPTAVHPVTDGAAASVGVTVQKVRMTSKLQSPKGPLHQAVNTKAATLGAGAARGNRCGILCNSGVESDSSTGHSSSESDSEESMVCVVVFMFLLAHPFLACGIGRVQHSCMQHMYAGTRHVCRTAPSLD